jgi:hypothetical protein
MSKIFQEALKLTNRIPDKNTFLWMFESLLQDTHIDDVDALVESLIDYASARRKTGQVESVEK